MERLLDLAARVTGKHISCEELEKTVPPLDEPLLKKVALWAFPQDEQEVVLWAKLASQSHVIRESEILIYDVVSMWQVGFMATAIMGGDMRVSLTFEKQCLLQSTCTACVDHLWCPHMMAAIRYRIRHPDKVTIYAPLTETLAAMDRTQLQKLLQYAVQEEPAIILACVSKHLDAVQDSSSHVSTESGMPDPTFGGIGERNQWEKSLDEMDLQFRTDLLHMCACDMENNCKCDSSSLYSYTKDKVKLRSMLIFTYVDQALQMHRLGNIKCAVAIFKTLLTAVFRVWCSSYFDCKTLQRFLHDFSQIVSLYVMHPSLPKKMKSELIGHTEKYQKNSEMSVGQHINRRGYWADFPSLLSSHDKRLSTDLQEGIFTEILCAGQVPEWPEDLTQYLHSTGSMSSLGYKFQVQDIPLSLAQFDSVQTIGTCPHEQLVRFAVVILQELVKHAMQYSILDAYIHSMAEAGGVDDDYICMLRKHILHDASQVMLQSTLSTAKSCVVVGKRKLTDKENIDIPSEKRSRVTREGAVLGAQAENRSSPNDIKSTAVSSSGMKKGHVAYAILSLVEVLIQQPGHDCLPEDVNDRIPGYCMLGLEMSRFHLYVPREPMTQVEQNHVIKLEQKIQKHIRTEASPSAVQAVAQLYLRALRNEPISFYKPVFPLVLLDSLFSYIMSERPLFLANMALLLKMSGQLLCLLVNMLEKFREASKNIPEKSIQAITWDFEAAEHAPYKQDYVLTKFQTVVSTFFKMITFRKLYDDRLTVFCVLSQCRDEKLLQLVVSHMQKHWDSLKSRISPLKNLMKITHQFLAVSNSDYVMDTSFISFVSKLLKELKLDGLDLISEVWQKVWSPKCLRDLLMLLETDIRAEDMPAVVVLLIHQYFSCRKPHDDNPVDLLSFFELGSQQYKIAISEVLSNTKAYSQVALLTLAEKNLLIDLSLPTSAVESDLPVATPSGHTPGEGERVDKSDQTAELTPGSDQQSRSGVEKDPATSNNIGTAVSLDRETDLSHTGVATNKGTWRISEDSLSLLKAVFYCEGAIGNYGCKHKYSCDHTLSKPDEETMDVHLRQWCNACSTNIEDLKRLVGVAKTCCDRKILNSLLLYLDDVGAKFREPEDLLLDEFIDLFQSYFVHYVREVNHLKYPLIVSNMLAAQEVCMKYGHPKAKERFDVAIVHHTVREHPGKRKLLGLMAESFSLQFREEGNYFFPAA